MNYRVATKSIFILSASVVLGGLFYWLVEFLISKFPGHIMGLIYVLLSPISIFGWILFLTIVVAIFACLGRLFNRVGNASTKSAG